jgi:hypothetical protein
MIIISYQVSNRVIVNVISYQVSNRVIVNVISYQVSNFQLYHDGMLALSVVDRELASVV